MSEGQQNDYLQYMNNPPINNYINDKLYLMRNISNILYDGSFHFIHKPRLIRQFIDMLPPRVAAKDLNREYEQIIGFAGNTSLIKTNEELWDIWKKVCDWCYDNLFKQNFNPLQSADLEKLDSEEEPE